MNFRSVFLLITVLFLNTTLFGQELAYNLSEEEQELNIIFDSLRLAQTDAEKATLNNKVIDWLSDILDDDRSFSYNFSIVDKIGILNSDDGRMRIYNWNVLFAGNVPKYYAFVQYYHPKKDEYFVYQLHDKSDELTNPALKSLGADDWYGSLYYQIITCKDKEGPFYTLLGWDGNNSLVNRKVIDILSFSSIGKPRFGRTVFELQDEKIPGKPNKKLKRVIFEYSARASMILKYDPIKDFIFFDHLAPIELKYKDIRQYYGPDMTQDIMKFKNGIWVHQLNADLRRAKRKSEEPEKPARSDNFMSKPPQTF